MLAEPAETRGMVFGRSIRGLDWKFEECCDRVVRTLCQKLDISEILAKILYNRGIHDAEEAANFLDPKLKNMILDPFSMKDMEPAALRIVKAIKAGERICIFGDYDVDGATSSSLFKRFFREFGMDVMVYIPNRMKEGYGPSNQAFEKIKEEGCTLVITVDCGTASFGPISFAKTIGIDVVVVDHHLGSEQLPEAVAVVNPNRFDETFAYKSMAAVGVAFMVVVAVRAKLREQNWFVEAGIDEPDVLKYLDLVALGTVCDVMLLRGINRAFVVQGLKVISRRTNTGIASLANVLKLEGVPRAHHLGYVFGPRINAGGRVGEGMLGTKLLSTDCPQEAYQLASRLEKYNEERRSIESIALEDAIMQVERGKLYDMPMILVQSTDWHVGVLGILASRLKEKYLRPSGVMLIQGGVAKGSARSIPGLDLGVALMRARAEGLLIEGGGHAMAGGFTLAEDNIPAFRDFLMEELDAGSLPLMQARELHIDHILSISSINGSLLAEIEMAAPYGNGNISPRFVLHNVIVVSTVVVGGDHIMVIVADSAAGPRRRTQKCIMFKSVTTDVGQFLLKSVGKKLSLAGSLQYNNLDHNKVDFVIEDVSINE